MGSLKVAKPLKEGEAADPTQVAKQVSRSHCPGGGGDTLTRRRGQAGTDRLGCTSLLGAA